MSQNVFLLLSNYLLEVNLKKFKTNKATLTIVIGLNNILCWNLVKSALDKKDKSVHVPVYSPVFNFLFVVTRC